MTSKIVAAGTASPADHAAKALTETLNDEMHVLLNRQAAHAAIWRHGEMEEMALGAGAAIALMGPGDPFEQIVVRQMIAIHNAAMNCLATANVLGQPELIVHSNLNSANKCLRTFTTLLEALNRHRGKGQQNVTVRHVHVHDGGQAIVGNVGSGGGAGSRTKEQPHTIEQAVRRDDAERSALPELGNGERALPDARRPLSRRAEGKPERPETRSLE